MSRSRTRRVVANNAVASLLFATSLPPFTVIAPICLLARVILALSVPRSPLNLKLDQAKHKERDADGKMKTSPTRESQQKMGWTRMKTRTTRLGMEKGFVLYINFSTSFQPKLTSICS